MASLVTDGGWTHTRARRVQRLETRPRLRQLRRQRRSVRAPLSSPTPETRVRLGRGRHPDGSLVTVGGWASRPPARPACNALFRGLPPRRVRLGIGGRGHSGQCQARGSEPSGTTLYTAAGNASPGWRVPLRLTPCHSAITLSPQKGHTRLLLQRCTASCVGRDSLTSAGCLCRGPWRQGCARPPRERNRVHSPRPRRWPLEKRRRRRPRASGAPTPAVWPPLRAPVPGPMSGEVPELSVCSGRARLPGPLGRFAEPGTAHCDPGSSPSPASLIPGGG